MHAGDSELPILLIGRNWSSRKSCDCQQRITRAHVVVYIGSVRLGYFILTATFQDMAKYTVCLR